MLRHRKERERLVTIESGTERSEARNPELVAIHLQLKQRRVGRERLAERVAELSSRLVVAHIQHLQGRIPRERDDRRREKFGQRVLVAISREIERSQAEAGRRDGERERRRELAERRRARHLLVEAEVAVALKRERLERARGAMRERVAERGDALWTQRAVVEQELPKGKASVAHCYRAQSASDAVDVRGPELVF